ncbi:hypothetical protein [Methylophilus sp. 3sh_L]
MKLTLTSLYQMRLLEGTGWISCPPQPYPPVIPQPLPQPPEPVAPP